MVLGEDKEVISYHENGSYQNGDSDLFLSYNGSSVKKTTNSSFTECNSVFSVASPYFTEVEVMGVEVFQERDTIMSYQVKEGDTLEGIAEMFSVSTDTIKWNNNIDNGVKKGDELLILPTTGIMYYVERGDTIGKIANLHKADAEEIISFNSIDEASIVPGDRLIIPDGEMPPPPPPRSTTPTRTATGPVPSGTSSASGFINPVPGGMITQSTHPYNAVDIYEPCGRPIVASASGRVTEVGRGSWPAGNYIKIDHGNVVILYAHMQSIYVNTGQQVAQGEQVGTVGNTGRTVGRTGCHLHFDVLSRSIRNPFGHLSTGTRLP